MLYGIDISNWQKGIDLDAVQAKNELDFVIAKATEGTGYVDRTCDRYVQWCIANDVLFGYYHFARNDSPEREAEVFVDMTEGYIGHGIPVLDLEDSAIVGWKGYVDSFTKRFHDLTDVWPMVYVSAGNLPLIKGCSAYEHCALWVAGYPAPYKSYDQLNIQQPPYTLEPWSTWTLWQFTSSGRLSGFGADLDLDLANLDRDGWMRIAKGERQECPALGNLDDALSVVADHVIMGEFGNGDERKQNVYNAVQERVNLQVVH